MTVNGLLRSMAASARRAEREAIRRQREYDRQQKQFAKLQAIQEASLEVEEYENRIELLKSMHQDCSDVWNWNKIKESNPPEKPFKRNKYETFANDQLNNFKPTFFDKLFRKVEIKKSLLEKETVVAKQKDEAEYKKEIEKYNNAFTEWVEIRDLAIKILDGDVDAYRNAIEQIEPFGEINEIGSSIDFKIINSNEIDITLNVNSTDTIPSEEKSQLKSGKLSIKKMPKGKFYELYQDYVCSCILRVAREIFALLPVEKVYITALAELLNTKTGYIENQPVLSVLIPQETLNKLNFSMIDPSDSMKNFVHNMNFKKTTGFDIVEKLQY